MSGPRAQATANLVTKLIYLCQKRLNLRALFDKKLRRTWKSHYKCLDLCLKPYQVIESDVLADCGRHYPANIKSSN
jgi:hypothetical protein